jgi:hypothetical protein
LSDDGCKNVPGADQNSIFASVERIAEEGVARAIQAHVLARVGSGSLTLFRARLYHTLLSAPSFSAPELAADGEKINDVADRIRSGGVQYMVLLVLLTRAWLRFLSGARTGPESAQADLDEAWEIAERGPMKLFLADIHLHRARLFFRERQYPWESPQADLDAAEKLINECGYHRRDEELADAKAALQSR